MVRAGEYRLKVGTFLNALRLRLMSDAVRENNAARPRGSPLGFRSVNDRDLDRPRNLCKPLIRDPICVPCARNRRETRCILIVLVSRVG